MAMNRFFRCFCINQFGMRPLQYHSSCSDFGFELVEIFLFEKWLPAINDRGSRRLRVSVIRGVADSPYQWYAESPTPHISDTVCRRLPRIFESGSRRLCVSLIRRVDNSAYRWVGESTLPVLVSRYLIKISTVGNGWDLADSGWDLAECGWDLAELWMRSSWVWMRSSRVVDEI